MATGKKRRWYLRWIFFSLGFLLGLFLLLFAFVNFYLEPILRNRIHILIVQGSDSLYTYKLGKIRTNILGGNVEIEDLEIRVDTTHYLLLKARNALPSLTMELNLKRGYLKGIGVLALMFSRKITVEELMSSEAHIRLSRHPHRKELILNKVPMWKAIQPKINAIVIRKIKLDGIKLHYTNADTTQSVKFEFDRCDALLKDIKIDSASSVDTSRIGFTRSIFFRFNGLKFRTNDSTYKMKAKWFTYSSTDRYIQIDSFKLQPTLDKATYYQKTRLQKDLYYVEFDKIRMVNVSLDHFIRNDLVDPDSIIIERPRVSVYLDKGQDPIYESKIGKFPHEVLLHASSTIMIRNLFIRGGEMSYTETNPKKDQEGQLNFTGLNINIQNITNDSGYILHHPLCLAKASGNLFGVSPVMADFTFYLDSSNGRFDVKGTVNQVTAQELNPLARALTNMDIRSFHLKQVDFLIHGADYEASADVRMNYDQLFLVVLKTDDETGKTKTKKFMTRLLNRYIIWPSNPMPGASERMARNTKVYRLTTESFFGLIWKALFNGMQTVMMKQ